MSHFKKENFNLLDAAPSGVDLIAKERKRQVEEEGWTSQHDSEHMDGELAEAAAAYAAGCNLDVELPITAHPDGNKARVTLLRATRWPWDIRGFKPTPNNRIRELVKAGALIAAEIDRLQALEAYLDFEQKKSQN